MMKKITLYFLLFSPNILFGQQDSCIVEGQIANFKSNIRITLSIAGNVNEADFREGKFLLTSEVSHPVLAILNIYYQESKRPFDYIPIFLQKGIIYLIISNPDSTFKLLFNGPELSSEYQFNLWEPVKKYNEEMKLLDTKYQYSVKYAISDTSILSGELTLKQKKCWQVPKDYIMRNPTSLVSIEALKFLGNGDPSIPDKIQELQALYNSLSKDIKNSPEGIKYAEKLKKLSALKIR